MTDERKLTGRVHSIQSMGTLDGPGVRFVVFMQGCNLRCGCCHNPDTWMCDGGKIYTPKEIASRAMRYREYFGIEGGITVSGGEPLLQADFVCEVFELCRAEGINTCLDTSGCILNESVEKLLDVTDRVLLDVKYIDAELYRKYVGCDFDDVMKFLGFLDEKKIATTLRQVTIPTLNDTDDDILALCDVAKDRFCVDKIELLPFKKICQVKYDELGIDFRFADIPTPTGERMKHLKSLLGNYA